MTFTGRYTAVNLLLSISWLLSTSMGLAARKFYRFSISVLFLVLGLNFASWSGRIPDVQKALGLNDAQLGLVLLASPVGNIAGAFLAGLLVEFLGTRKVLAFIVPFCSLALLSLGRAQTPMILACGLFCFGLTTNLFDNALNTQAVDVEKIYRRSIMLAFHGMWSVGGVIGSILCGFFAAAGISAATHFKVILCISVGIFLLLRRYTIPRALHRVKCSADSWAGNSTGGAWTLVLLGTITFCSMATEGAMYNWSSIYFQSVLQTPLPLVRLGYVACMVAMVLGRFSSDRFIIRWGEVRVLRSSGALIVVGFFLIFVSHGIALATFGFTLIGLGMATGVPTCFSLAGRLPNISPSVAIASVTAISLWGFLLTPPIIGFLSHFFNLRIALASMGLMGLCIFALAPMLRGRINFPKQYPAS
ncbi:MAG: MFS transporter [Puniceicoccales bacterium]|jgi:MFS family permease|nr:MFS transporter [Puniceicoccales bacterium]